MVTSSGLSKIPSGATAIICLYSKVNEISRIDSYAKQQILDSVLVDDMYLPHAYFESLRRKLDEHGESVLVAIDDLRERSLR